MKTAGRWALVVSAMLGCPSSPGEGRPRGASAGSDLPPQAMAEKRTEPVASEAGADAESMNPNPRPEPIGGAWVTCYGQFRPTSAPARDVLRLGILCGPSNGMRQVGGTIEGEAADAPVEHGVEAKPGECFRIFAVGDPAVLELQIEVRSPAGLEVAADHNNDRWPIVNPDGPFCAIEGGQHKIRVRARRGRGRFALQVWKLP